MILASCAVPSPVLNTRMDSAPSDRPLRRPPSRTTRWVLLAVGCVCVPLGIVGLILPVMPGTVFLILAAWCFARSSPRFETWLLTHPRLGPPVVAWRDKGSIAPRVKLIAAASMALSFGLVWISGAPPIALVSTAVSLICVLAYLLTRPSA